MREHKGKVQKNEICYSLGNAQIDPASFSMVLPLAAVSLALAVECITFSLLRSFLNALLLKIDLQ